MKPASPSLRMGLHPASLAPAIIHQIPGVRHIEVSLRNVEQLFNTMDPSPFHEKDLDRDAEEFIFGWAQEYHHNEPLDLVVHLEKVTDEKDPTRLVTDAVHNYFGYRARLNELEFKRLMKQGRVSLLVGVSFLSFCLAATEIIVRQLPGTMARFLSEGLTIAGWVAMWKPMQIYLYDWWPLRRRGKIFEKLSTMSIEVRSHR
jgi:hypothetical protein